MQPAQLMVEGLSKANAKVEHWLEHVSASTAADYGDPISDLLATMLTAGEILREGVPVEPDPELERMIATYRHNLDRLHSMLPAIHEKLIHQKGILEAERTRMQGGLRWAECARSTRGKGLDRQDEQDSLTLPARDL